MTLGRVNPQHLGGTVSPSNRAMRWTVTAAMAVLAAGALVMPAAAAGQPQATVGTAAPSATALAAQVHQEVNSGTLLRDHGVKRIGGLTQGLIVTAAKGSNKPLSTAAPAGKGPADLAALYNITGTSTATTTIAVLDAGVDPNISSDLATYRSTFGLPACTTGNGCLKLVNFNGGAQPRPQRPGTQGSNIEEQIAVETSL